MSQFRFKSTLVVLFITLCTVSLSAQTVDQIIAKHIEAMGGTAKLEALKSVRIAAQMKAMNVEIPVTTTIIQNQGFRTETTMQGMTIVQVVNGTTGWMINPLTGQTKATAMPEDAVKPLSGQTDLTGLYNYQAKGYTLKLDGEENLDGARVYKITATLKNGVKQVNYISKDTYYILKIVASLPIEGQNVVTESKQSDFRKIDGITFPFSNEVTTSAMPDMNMLNKIISVEVNPKISPTIFDMPKE